MGQYSSVTGRPRTNIHLPPFLVYLYWVIRVYRPGNHYALYSSEPSHPLRGIFFEQDLLSNLFSGINKASRPRQAHKMTRIRCSFSCFRR